MHLHENVDLFYRIPLCSREIQVNYDLNILRARKIEDIPHELLQSIFYLKCFRATTQTVVQIEDGL